MKIVRGINNRGVIISYIHFNYEEEKRNYTTYIYIKCKKSISDSEETLKLVNRTDTENMTYYYFIAESDTVCPICLKSEVIEVKTGQCPKDEYELYTNNVKETSECVIKPLKEITTSELIIKDNSNFLLFSNSALEDDINLINNYQIDENIPITYETEGDNLVTIKYRYNYCEKKDDDDDGSLGGGYIALIVIACLLVVVAIVFILWKFVLNRKMNDSELIKDKSREMKLQNTYSE